MKQIFLCLLLFSFSHLPVRAQPYDSTDVAELPTVLWQFKSKGSFYTTPVVTNNTIYIGSTDSSLYAINMETGAVRWTYSTRGDIRSTVCLHNHNLYFISGDGYLYCITQASGKLVWKFRTGGEQKYSQYSFADYFQSSPVIDNNVVYFGSGDHQVYAVTAEEGKLVWRFSTNDIVHAKPAMTDSTVFIGSFDGFFYALNKQTGKESWRFKSVGQEFFTKGEMMGSPAVFEKFVFVGSRDYNFYALDQKSPFCHWNMRFVKGWAMSPPVFHDSALYLGTSDDHLLLKLVPATGAVLWKTDLKFNIFGAPCFSKNLLYVGTLMGKLFAIDIQTGTVVWEFHTDGYKQNRLNYFKEDDRFRDDITTLLNTGEKYIHALSQLDAVFSQPLLYDNKIVFSTVGGSVYCLKKRRT